MNRTAVTSLVGTVAAAALVVGACAPAFASTAPTHNASKNPHTLASVQAAAERMTGKQEAALTSAIARVDAAKGTTASDKTTLLARLTAELNELKASAARVAADTTRASASAELKTIRTAYRADRLTISQAHLIVGIDRVVSIEIPTLTAAETKLSAALSGKDAAKSTAALQADLADLKAQTDAARTALSGVSAKVLSATSADINANRAVFQSARASMKVAHTDLVKAKADRRAIHIALK